MTKIKNNKGAAMIMVVCLMAIITVLCLSLLLSSSVVLGFSQSEIHKEQARIMAVSISKEIEYELTSNTHIYSSDEQESSANDGSLWFFVKDGINTKNWPYYNDDERGHTSRFAFRTFKFDVSRLPNSLLEQVGQIEDATVTMYWESAADTALDNTPLMVKVTCQDQKQKCTISTEFTLGIDYEAGYKCWTWSLNWRE